MAYSRPSFLRVAAAAALLALLDRWRAAPDEERAANLAKKEALCVRVCADWPRWQFMTVRLPGLAGPD